MNTRVLSIILTILGLVLIIVNYPLKPFDSNFQGPLVILFEFVGPMMFISGASIFGYQLNHYIKHKDWLDEIPNRFLIYSMIVGFLASVVVLIVRISA